MGSSLQTTHHVPGCTSLGHTLKPGPAVPQRPEAHALPQAQGVRWKDQEGPDSGRPRPRRARLWPRGGERHIMMGDPAMLSPKILSCGCPTQPWARARMGEARGGYIHTASDHSHTGILMASQTVDRASPRPGCRQTQGPQSDGKWTWAQSGCGHTKTSDPDIHIAGMPR